MTKWGEKPYHSLDYMLRERFGEKAVCPVPTETVRLEPAAASSAAQEEAEISLQMLHFPSLTR